MSRQSRLGSVAATALMLSSAACATAPSPWQLHERTADYKAFASDTHRMCPVVIQNATEQMLEAQVDLDGVGRNVGRLASGQSVTVDVSCSARQVHAQAVGQDLGPTEGTRFRKSAVLDVMKETRLRFTLADQVRR